MKAFKLVTLLTMVLVLSACSSDMEFKARLVKTLKDDPSILQEVIAENPTEFVMAFQKAVKDAQEDMARKRKFAEEKQLEESFKKPLAPLIRKDEAILGKSNAPLTLVEYTDFQCPYCKRGKETVDKLRDKYGDKIKVVFKHLPLSFHTQAQLAAQYYEALRLQKNDFAHSFHDLVFESQDEVKKGEIYFSKLAKKIGADMNQLKTDLNSKVVLDRIDQDKLEAQNFGFQGTPGFLINGVPVRGAYPAEYFDNLIEELKKRKLVEI